MRCIFGRSVLKRHQIKVISNNFWIADIKEKWGKIRSIAGMKPSAEKDLATKKWFEEGEFKEWLVKLENSLPPEVPFDITENRKWRWTLWRTFCDSSVLLHTPSLTSVLSHCCFNRRSLTGSVWARQPAMLTWTSGTCWGITSMLSTRWDWDIFIHSLFGKNSLSVSLLNFIVSTQIDLIHRNCCYFHFRRVWRIPQRSAKCSTK